MFISPHCTRAIFFRQLARNSILVSCVRFLRPFRRDLIPTWGHPDEFLIRGESGGTSCFYDLAERYRLRNLVAERDTRRIRETYGTIATSKTPPLK